MTQTPVVLSVTGLRSHKLFGNKNYNDRRYIRLINEMMRYLYNHPEIHTVNNGLATGSDLLMGLAVLKFNATIEDRIKLSCFIPGRNQTQFYSQKEKEIYSFILTRAHNIIQVSQGPCTPNALKKRNRVMIDAGTNRVLSFWDYGDQRSGTYMTMNYARKNDITVYNINPKDIREQGFYAISSKDDPESIVAPGERLILHGCRKEDLYNRELLRGYTDELAKS